MDNRIGRRVRQLRYERRKQGLPWSQAWLAEAAGCSRQTVMNLEAGSYFHRSGEYVEYVPSDEILDEIAWALHTTLEKLSE